jgi:hypothetical protein
LHPFSSLYFSTESAEKCIDWVLGAEINSPSSTEHSVEAGSRHPNDFIRNVFSELANKEKK